MQDKKTLFAWGKTLLQVYKYLETVSEAIDNLVLKQGINSGKYYSGNVNSTYNCANKIIELTSRKQTLINLKIITEDAMVKLTTTNVRLLILTYFDLLKSSIVAQRLGVSIRSYFRQKNLAIMRFGAALSLIGYDCNKLTQLLKCENWIINLYNKNLSELEAKTTQCENQNNDFKLLKCIISDINSTVKKNYVIN